MTKTKKLGLGTVQWGLDYGVANKSGKTEESEVAKILNFANDNGICFLDTAPAYGNAEKILGKNTLDSFKIITKTKKIKSDAEQNEIRKIIVENFDKSLKALSKENIYGLIVHDINDLKNKKGECIVSALEDLKKEKRIEKIGVSIYSEQDLECVFGLFRPDIIQLPFSVINQTFLKSGVLKKIKDMQIEVHARSVFLQGLMLQPVEQYSLYFKPYVKLLANWHKKVKENQMTPMEAALSFVKNNEFIDVVIIGVNNLWHIMECFEAFNSESEFDGSDLWCEDSNLINPSKWKL